MGVYMNYIIENERIYAKNDEDKVICEINFPHTFDGVSTITHTWTDESLRGQGVARELVMMAVEEIKKKGDRVEATCSYAKHLLEKEN